MAKKKTNIGFAPAAAAVAGNLSKNTQTILAVGVLAVVGVGLYIITSPLRAVSAAGEALKDDPKDKAKVEAGRHSNAFNTRYWYNLYKAGKNPLIWDRATAQSFATKLYNSIGTVLDNEAAIYGVYERQKTHAHASHVADEFYKKYGISLFAHLEDNLSAKEMAKVVSILEQKPAYKKG